MLLPLVILIPLLGAWLPAALSRAFGIDPAHPGDLDPQQFGTVRDP